MKSAWVWPVGLLLVLCACNRPTSHLSEGTYVPVRELEKQRLQGTDGVAAGTSEQKPAAPIYMSGDKPLYVQEEGIIFTFDKDFPEAFKAACLRAIDTANAALGRTAFMVSTKTGVYNQQSDDRNVISWGKGSEKPPTIDGTKKYIHAAETSIWYGSQSGVIGEADIDFDMKHVQFTVTGEKSKADVETTCLHELGHAMGLAHSQDESSIMYSIGDVSMVRRHFAPADIANLRAAGPSVMASQN